MASVFLNQRMLQNIMYEPKIRLWISKKLSFLSSPQMFISEARKVNFNEDIFIRDRNYVSEQGRDNLRRQT